MSNSNQYSCFLLLFLSLVLGNVAHAQTETADPYHDLPTKQIYTEGTNLLSHGHSFEKVIAIFSELSRREPKNGEYKVILGTACASRAFTISRAYAYSITYANIVPYYERKMARWRAAQEDKTSPAYGVPEPEKPSPPMIADDNQRFKFTAEEARARIKELSLAAQTHLKEGVELCANEPPATRARLLNLQGWALLLLWIEPRRSTPESWGKKDGAAEVVAALEAAAALQPENLTYLRSLGDGCVVAARDDLHTIDRTSQLNKPLIAKGVLILRRVLERTPDDGILWLQIAELASNKSPESWGKTDNSENKESAFAVQHALNLNPTNALLWYDLAALLPTQTDENKLLATLEQGNEAPVLKPVRYNFTHPKLLSWAFPQQTCLDIKAAFMLIPTFDKLAEEATTNKDQATLLRLARIALNMAKKYQISEASVEASISESRDFGINSEILSMMSTERLMRFKTAFPNIPTVDSLLSEAKAIEDKYAAERNSRTVLDDGLIRPPKM